MIQEVIFQDWGRVDYEAAWIKQQQFVDIQTIAKREGVELENRPPHHLIICDHPHVYTLGKSGSVENLLLTEEERINNDIQFFKINRGGDITYHGPGQLIAYPILDLERIFTDVHKYISTLEEIVIQTLAYYHVEGTRLEGYTGVWLRPNDQKPWRKICAIGVHLSRWVTMHGLAFNVNSDLKYFEYIIPCGIADDDKGVTSLQIELNRQIDVSECKKVFIEAFEKCFEVKVV